MISNNTYEEVYEILGYMDKKTVMKVPEYILREIKNKRNKNYITKIDRNDIFNEKNVSKETIDILCWLDYNYWIDEYKKMEVDRLYKQKYLQNEIEKNSKYNPNDIFKKDNLNEKISETKENVQIVEYKKQRWYEKLFARIIKIFKK